MSSLRRLALDTPGSLETVELQVEARLNTRRAAFDVLTPPNPEYRRLVSVIDVPTLLVIGDSDPVVTAETATDLRRLNPLIRVEEVQSAGHGLPFQQPMLLGKLVLSFVRSLR